jgi:hypothetical protein
MDRRTIWQRVRTFALVGVVGLGVAGGAGHGWLGAPSWPDSSWE